MTGEEEQALIPSPASVDGEVETVTQEPPAGPGTINQEGEHSLLNLLDHKLREFVAALPDDLLIMSDQELKNQARPTSTDYSLRRSFWREYEKSSWRGTGKIRALNVYAGICTDQYFYSKFLRNPKKLAWMVRPMQEYAREMEALCSRGNERFWELLEMKVTDKLGRVDARKAEVLLKVIAEVHNRARGMVVQKVDKRTLSVHVRTPASPVPKGAASTREIDDEIARMEGEILEAERTSLPAAPSEAVEVRADGGAARVPEAARSAEGGAGAAGESAGSSAAPLRGSSRRFD